MQTQATNNTALPRKAISVAIYIAVLAFFWSVAIGLSLWFNISRTYDNAESTARIQARTAFEKDVIYRRWNSRLGGIYALVTPDTPKNPYLQNDPERDIIGPHGREYTKINPAYMTRLVHELGEISVGTGIRGIQGHITSNKPIRPDNKPDAWEADALYRLEKQKTDEVSSVEMVDGKKYLRFIRPLMTEQSCLSCHAFQGYKVGEQRGGISVTVPMAPLLAAANHTIQTLSYSHAALWLLGILALFAGNLHIEKRVRERDQAELALRQMTLERETCVAQPDNKSPQSQPLRQQNT